MQTRCQVLACHGTLDAPLGVHAMEIQVDHRCALESVTERIARVTNAGGAREEARRALDELLADRDFDRCCVPHYLAPAPRAGERELEIPVAEAGRIRTRVIVWPVGAKDVRHPHTDGWAAFIDSNLNGSFEDEMPLHDYREGRETIALGTKPITLAANFAEAERWYRAYLSSFPAEPESLRRAGDERGLAGKRAHFTRLFSPSASASSVMRRPAFVMREGKRSLSASSWTGMTCVKSPPARLIISSDVMINEN